MVRLLFLVAGGALYLLVATVGFCLMAAGKAADDASDRLLMKLIGDRDLTDGHF